jgi:DNA-binding Lrp family transcriptional regulator
MLKCSLGAIDRRIVAELQADARLSNVQLAERVGLSPSRCLRRVKRLEQARYIESCRAALRREPVGPGSVAVQDDGAMRLIQISALAPIRHIRRSRTKRRLKEHGPFERYSRKQRSSDRASHLDGHYSSRFVAIINWHPSDSRPTREGNHSQRSLSPIPLPGAKLGSGDLNG